MVKQEDGELHEKSAIHNRYFQAGEKKWRRGNLFLKGKQFVV